LAALTGILATVHRNARAASATSLVNAKLHACIVILRQVLKDRSNVDRFLPNLEVCAVMRKLAQNLADKAVAVIP